MGSNATFHLGTSCSHSQILWVKIIYLIVKINANSMLHIFPSHFEKQIYECSVFDWTAIKILTVFFLPLPRLPELIVHGKWEIIQLLFFLLKAVFWNCKSQPFESPFLNILKTAPILNVSGELCLHHVNSFKQKVPVSARNLWGLKVYPPKKLF